MTLLSFTLSMPNNNAWNGKWSGAGKSYVRVEKIKPDVAAKLIEEGYYHYNFGDGWAAGVTVKLTDSKEAAKLRKASAGFSGYDWMIWEIIKYGKIYGRHPKPDEKTYTTIEEAEDAA